MRCRGNAPSGQARNRGVFARRSLRRTHTQSASISLAAQESRNIERIAHRGIREIHLLRRATARTGAEHAGFVEIRLLEVRHFHGGAIGAVLHHFQLLATFFACRFLAAAQPEDRTGDGRRVAPLAEKVGAKLVLPCDVEDPATVAAVFETLGKEWGSLDFVVHAIGFSNKEELKGKYVDTSLDNFLLTMNISVYSFTAVAKRAEPLMSEGGSLLTLTYYGAEKVMPHYNVMGVAKAGLEASVKYMAMDLGPRNIRVNALSAGPIKTLAASGIGDFRYIMKWNELNSPLRRNVTQTDVGKSAMFLLSDLSSGVTGENLHVDAGYHVVGMKAEDAPDIDVVSGRKEA